MKEELCYYLATHLSSTTLGVLLALSLVLFIISDGALIYFGIKLFRGDFDDEEEEE